MANHTGPSGEIASAAGPVFLGVLMTWFLMGVYTMQAHFYFMSYNDPLFVRVLVITVSALEVAQWITSTSNAWYYLVKNWDNVSVYIAVPWQPPALVTLCGITSMIVQGFYAWRIWTIGHNAWLLRLVAVLVGGVSLMQGFSAITAAALVLRNPNTSEVSRRHELFVVWLAGSLTTDTLISLGMLWILFKARVNSPLQSMKVIFNKVIVNTVKTGAATTITVAVNLALFGHAQNHRYATTSNYLQKLQATLFHNAALADILSLGTP
ncbi:hypothetical protein MVEN_01943200 [Mycena venus]|uniref:Uncharacterized protein n=1 Tax=Mycena venus TaxID=2733690 RepID=A0A8H6XF18_9AGAR|nr:hypothetical protein MVEN_01943200 [Mycena venus]